MAHLQSLYSILVVLTCFISFTTSTTPTPENEPVDQAQEDGSGLESGFEDTTTSPSAKSQCIDISPSCPALAEIRCCEEAIQKICCDRCTNLTDTCSTPTLIISPTAPPSISPSITLSTANPSIAPSITPSIAPSITYPSVAPTSEASATMQGASIPVSSSSTSIPVSSSSTSSSSTTSSSQTSSTMTSSTMTSQTETFTTTTLVTARKIDYLCSQMSCGVNFESAPEYLIRNHTFTMSVNYTAPNAVSLMVKLVPSYLNAFKKLNPDVKQQLYFTKIPLVGLDPAKTVEFTVKVPDFVFVRSSLSVDLQVGVVFTYEASWSDRKYSTVRVFDVHQSYTPPPTTLALPATSSDSTTSSQPIVTEPLNRTFGPTTAPSKYDLPVAQNTTQWCNSVGASCSFSSNCCGVLQCRMGKTHKRCTQKRKNHTTDANEPTSSTASTASTTTVPHCIDSPSDWRDAQYHPCSKYKQFEWCTFEGEAGPGWRGTPPQFDLLSNSSESGYLASEACCSCGGGVMSNAGDDDDVIVGSSVLNVASDKFEWGIAVVLSFLIVGLFVWRSRKQSQQPPAKYSSLMAKLNDEEDDFPRSIPLGDHYAMEDTVLFTREEESPILGDEDYHGELNESSSFSFH